MAGVTADMYAPLPDVSERYPALDHHLICYCPTGSARLVQGRDGAVHEGASATARLRIPTALIASAAEQIGHRSTSRIEIRNVFETRDPIIEHVAQILIGELDRKSHPAQTLIVDHVSLALAAHLLRSYNVFEPVVPQVPSALSRVEVARIAAYVEDNLDRSIGLVELAAIVNVSRFHFTRLFKQSRGMTAIGFVEQCRIRRAQSLILETVTPLSEIALMAGFSDQSHFTRRFHRHMGRAPAAFARENGRRRVTKGGMTGAELRLKCE